MLSPWLLGVSLSILSAVEPSATPDLAGYETVKAAAGKDSTAQVKVALWCEAHGLSAERIKHLALAVLRDPTNVTARGLLGLVEYRNKWERPETVSQKVQSDQELTARLAEYNARRSRVGRSADDHWRLGLWCEEVGLDAEARAHFATVTRIDPSREAAWKRLGCKKAGNRWLTEQQLAAERAEAETQKQADKKWRPLLEKWHAAYFGKNETKRAEAEAALDALSDPRAVPVLWETFIKQGGEPSQRKAVEILGRLDGQMASQALAMVAIRTRLPEVRRAAAETLRRRDASEFLNLLIAHVRTPKLLRYEFKYIGADGLGSPGYVAIEMPDRIVRQTYTVDESLRGHPLLLAAEQFALQAQNGVFFPTFADSPETWNAAMIPQWPSWQPSRTPAVRRVPPQRPRQSRPPC